MSSLLNEIKPNSDSKSNRKRVGRGSLRIPLASSGSGTNFPTA